MGKGPAVEPGPGRLITAEPRGAGLPGADGYVKNARTCGRM